VQQKNFTLFVSAITITNMRIVINTIKKIFTLLLIYSTIFSYNIPLSASNSKNRPKIGLVLSGGGARGGAHIGVIKALEELNVPIDYITGTSIGALIGGMYASGISIDKIEKMVNNIDWGSIFDDTPSFDKLKIRKKSDIKKYIHPFNMGIKNFKIKLPKGIVTGQKINFAIQKMVLNGKQSKDFTKLPIPFKAVATDILTGKTVVISNGNFAKALRGSMSVPGVFSPVEYGKYLLVDGGLTNNIPIKLAKEMGADIVIAVDISAGLLNKKQLNNMLAVTRQMIKIMMQQNTDEQIAFLTNKDILITPDLGDMDSGQFDRLKEAADIGYTETLKQKDKLLKLALEKEKYKKYAQNKKANEKTHKQIVKNIVVSDNSRLNPQFFLKRIKTKQGKPLDLNKLEQDFESIYETGYFQYVDFEFDSENNLFINVKDKPWGPNLINLGLQFSSNFKGNGNLGLSFGLTKNQINSYAGELKFEVTTGSRSYLKAEFYQPLDYRDNLFFTTTAVYKKENNNYSIDKQNNHNEFSYKKFSISFELGKNFGSLSRFSGGLTFQKGSQQFSNNIIENYPYEKFNNIGWFADFQYSTMNKPYLETKGKILKLHYFKTLSLFSTDDIMFDKYQIDFRQVFTFNKHSLLINTSYGSSFKNQIPLFNSFDLQGFIGFLGSETGKISGSNIAEAGIY
jgi:NTE family protein